MKALTLWRPWDEAFLLIWGGLVTVPLKRIENRSWAPPPWMIDRPLVLHAGNHYDPEAAEALVDLGIPLVSREESDSKRRGRLFGVTVVRGFLDETKVSTQPELIRLDQLHWFSGPKAWVLDTPIRVEPDFRCRGHQGLWNVPSHLTDRLPTPEGIRP